MLNSIRSSLPRSWLDKVFNDLSSRLSNKTEASTHSATRRSVATNPAGSRALPIRLMLFLKILLMSNRNSILANCQFHFHCRKHFVVVDCTERSSCSSLVSLVLPSNALKWRLMVRIRHLAFDVLVQLDFYGKIIFVPVLTIFASLRYCKPFQPNSSARFYFICLLAFFLRSRRVGRRACIWYNCKVSQKSFNAN